MGFYWDRVFLLGLFWDAKGFFPGCKGEFDLDFDWDAKGFLPGCKGEFDLDFDWDAKGFLPGCKGKFDLDFTGMQRDFRDVRGKLTWILTGM